MTGNFEVVIAYECQLLDRGACRSRGFSRKILGACLY